MRLNATTDLRGALAKLDKVGGASRKLVSREVDVTAKTFTKEIATEWTPPAGPNLRGNAAQKAGENAVRRDIRRVIATASYAYGTIQNPHLADYFWLLIVSGQYVEAQDILRQHSYNVRTRYATITKRLDPAIHHRNRRPYNGRVPASTHVQQIVTNEGALNSYIRSQQKKVGLLAAGWLASARYFKITLPRWVERHKSGGKIRPSLLPWKTSYRITNDAKHGGANDLPRKAKDLAALKMNQLRRRLPFVIRAEIRKLTR